MADLHSGVVWVHQRHVSCSHGARGHGIRNPASKKKVPNISVTNSGLPLNLLCPAPGLHGTEVYRLASAVARTGRKRSCIGRPPGLLVAILISDELPFTRTLRSGLIIFLQRPQKVEPCQKGYELQNLSLGTLTEIPKSQLLRASA